MRRVIIAILVVGLVLSGCTAPAHTQEVPPTNANVQSSSTSDASAKPVMPWWKTAVFYEIFVRSFYDSNGDGIGDFKGLTEKLDYLNDGNPDTHTDLGIDAVWLMPINPSPSYHGYDVVNYYAVNSDYGTLDDFRNLLNEAHKRGIKVIIDLVLNHTSNKHPFFVDALRSVDSPYHDWYIWSDTDKGNYWHPATVGGKQLWYYGYFSDTMPDLNYNNPAVTAQMKQVTEYWLKTVGVDGFRVDAAKHLIEEGDVLMNTEATHAWFKDFYTFYKDINPMAYVVGEVASSDARLVESYTGDQFDQIFDFEMASGVVNSVKGEATSSIKSAVTFTMQDMPTWNFATFLTNHDQDRVMSTLGGNVDKAKLAAFILLTQPGVPFIYYGEEIGMTGQKPDENIRRPMQWSAEANGGFTSGTPWEALDAGNAGVNVAAQQGTTGSLLSTYQELIALRTAHEALSSGGYLPVKASGSGVYAFMRKSESETLLIVVDLTKKTISGTALGAEELMMNDGSYSVTNLLSGEPAADLMVHNAAFTNYVPLSDLASYTGYVFAVVKK